MTKHSDNCILRTPCRAADTSACSATCPSFLAIHGYDGRGGRAGNAGIPDDYRLLTSQSDVIHEIRRAQPVLNEIIDAYIDLLAGDDVKSLYLYSRSPGTGKTTTAAALLNEYITAHYIGSLKRKVAPSEMPAYFLDVNAWQTLYNEFNRPRVPEFIAEPAGAKYYRMMQRARSANFAVLDDIGVRDASEPFRADLHAIINDRVTAGKPTVYTSNVLMDELSAVFDARLADRIRDRCVMIAYKGESKRGMR